MSFDYEPKRDENDALYFTHVIKRTGESRLPHFHKSIELVCVKSGEMQSTVGQNRLTASAGDIVLVNSFDVHSTMYLTDCELFCMVISDSYLHDFKKSSDGKKFSHILDDKEYNRREIYPIAESFYARFNGASKLVAQGYISLILGLLQYRYPMENAESKSAEAFIPDVLSYIEKNFTDNITLVSLSERFGYCPQYLSKAFNRTVGMHLKNYVNNLRVTKAQELLSDESAGTVLDIALSCGFDSASSFYRAYKAAFGAAPKR
ncbi:MAG: helix-turn-helix domain-containing protein [Christensenellales bacterium]